MVEFGGLLGKAPVMAVSLYSSDTFFARGGIIPTLVRGFKN